MTTLLDLMLAPVRDAGFVRSEAFEPFPSSERHEMPGWSPRCRAAIDIVEVRPGRWVWRIEAETPRSGRSGPLVDRMVYATTREAAIHAAAADLLIFADREPGSKGEAAARRRIERWAVGMRDRPPARWGGAETMVSA